MMIKANGKVSVIDMEFTSFLFSKFKYLYSVYQELHSKRKGARGSDSCGDG